MREEGLVSFLGATVSFVRWKLKKAALEIRNVGGNRFYELAGAYYKHRRSFDTDQYTAPLDPYKIIWISPDRITRTTGRKIHNPYKERTENFGTVNEGNWDVRDGISIKPWKPEKYGGDNRWLIRLLAAKEFEESVFYKSLESHFVDGKQWQNTDFYRLVMQGLEEGKPTHEYAKSKEEFETKLSRIDELYESIRERGVLPQSDVSSESFLRLMNDSILVDIDRKGDFLFVEGRRRLSVAKILDVEEVPVGILVRHRKWMEHRDNVYKKGLFTRHPDFSEFGKEW